LSLINFGIDEFVSPRLRSAGHTKIKTTDGRTVKMRVGFTPVLSTKGTQEPVTPVLRKTADKAKGAA
jgi:peptide/nickel transport system permease protein